MQAKTKKQLAQDYNISPNTLKRWLKSVPGLQNTQKKRIFTPLELHFIYLHLGNP